MQGRDKTNDQGLYVATLSDLPAEILYLIFVQVDSSTLFSLSQINHTLNRLALDHFFIHEARVDPRRGYIVAHLAPRLLLPALYSALWLNHLPHVTYFLSPGIRHLFDEVYGLIRLIEKVERNDTLDLRFSSTWNSDAASGPGHAGVPATKIDSNVWVKMWVRLLETVLRKGCRSMKIEGEHWWLETHYTRHHMQVANAAATVATAVASSPPRLPPIPEEVTSFQTSDPCLTSLSLRSSMMMLGTIFPHTLNLIWNHSPVLRHLEIIGIKIDKSIWEDFLSKLVLPVLETFTYMCDVLIVKAPFVTPQSLLNFFIQHPTLRKIQLYGVSVHDTEVPIVNPTPLPNLQHLDAHPRIVSWLLQHSVSCPSLRFVSLTSEYLAPGPLSETQTDSYEDFDASILTLANLSGVDRLSQPPRQIHVQLKFNTEHSLPTWLLWHVDHASNLGYSSPIRRLKAVSRLTISAHYRVQLGKYLGLLPEFLGLFPSLKWLEMIGSADAEVVATDEAFIKHVKREVEGLERWAIEAVWVVGEKVEAGKEGV